MRRLATTLALVTLATSLAGCVTTQTGPIAGSRGASDGQIRARLAAVCPAPSELSPSQKRDVASAIERGLDDAGLRLLATEWDRLNEAARICRSAR